MGAAAAIDLHGRRALVTGAARGLGASIARRLAAAGAGVLVADVRKDLAVELCAELAADGGEARFVELDVRDAAGVAAVFRDLDGAGEPVDILVNNAAVDVSRPIEHLTAEEVTRVVETDLLGPMYLCLETYRRMIARGGGHIVNILSTAANRTWTEAAPYASAKSGLRAFTHTLFKEAQRDCAGIGVTGIIAGGMETPFVMERFPDADVAMLQSPDIVADTVLYALSVPAGSVVGELVVVPRREPSWP
ncbi:SDR family NAD(P)-dependent oxidoreductase [Streptomyces alfalfae]|uniref:2-hydroxycyclohexanecarboxyl-CoA dehydrogenase n=1 Tax=Streptomyces alfalfae TaxID=1642299 RepID=A0ABM6GP65_9ACTN|nr:SDR family oxidoreductase [Streptomyces alfalfae]AYA16041.1 SDR family oxidoreductase [Streptomyces fradiae]APY85685.1 2-hydroxycyclohexanecarboxyl-CoA dehydrogenase [Streptomyces alfalfae]QUI34588.1 SDR family oxidoreductase [Streptomyces alfalfae]RXX39513.1 SDR family NAD(P)-dependent oxidoreductase [Streptomyces alfalfae]RZN05874.1 SDR family oxidoreductase [Streptomyces alfalfae]